MPILANPFVQLHPLAPSHADALVQAAADPRTWEMTFPRINTPDDARQYIRHALDAPDHQAYAIHSVQHAQIVGSTRFCKIDRDFGSVEIGYTWLHPMAWRTPVNTSAKYLLMRHAFEQWNMKRVQLMTDERNARSRRAIERLGATCEGILRHHA